jgi:gas vesicle protein
MSDRKNHQNLLIGAAVAAGLLGALTTYLHFKKRFTKETSLSQKERGFFNKKVALGSLAGGVVGAASALLFAPKAGSELIQDISRPFSQYLKQSHSITPQKKKASSSTRSKRKVIEIAHPKKKQATPKQKKGKDQAKV